MSLVYQVNKKNVCVVDLRAATRVLLEADTHSVIPRDLHVDGERRLIESLQDLLLERVAGNLPNGPRLGVLLYLVFCVHDIDVHDTL